MEQRRAPGMVAHATGAVETYALGVKSGSFAFNSMRERHIRQEITCHRCRGGVNQYDCHGASVIAMSGEVARLYLCADCVRCFQEGGKYERA